MGNFPYLVQAEVFSSIVGGAVGRSGHRGGHGELPGDYSHF